MSVIGGILESAAAAFTLDSEEQRTGSAWYKAPAGPEKEALWAQRQYLSQKLSTAQEQLGGYVFTAIKFKAERDVYQSLMYFINDQKESAEPTATSKPRKPAKKKVRARKVKS